LRITEKSFERFGTYVNQDFFQFLNNTGRAHHFKKAENHILIDEKNIEYEDWVAGYGSLNLGHNPQQIMEAIQYGLGDKMPSLFLDAINPFSGELAELFCKTTSGHFHNVVFSSSGAEAVETAVKIAVAATKRTHVLSVEGAFHGTSIGALSFMANGTYVEDFNGIITKNPRIPWNDLDALEKCLIELKPAAFLIEPIQAEGGVRSASEIYFKKAHEICEKYGTLLILDEIQTGLGRCGSLFIYEQMGFVPDILLCGKSLGAGLVPISAALLKKNIWQKAFPGFLKCDIHNSTMAGNKISCIAAIQVLEVISHPNFLERVKALGAYLYQQLKTKISAFECVEEIRGQGLLYGLKIKEIKAPWLQWEQMGFSEFQDKPVAGAILVERMLRFKKITQVCAHDWSVLRIEPPLTINENIINDFVGALVASLQWMEENAY
jgi:putrescine aminotransferase